MGSKPYRPRNDQAGPPVMAVHLEKTGAGEVGGTSRHSLTSLHLKVWGKQLECRLSKGREEGNTRTTLVSYF